MKEVASYDLTELKRVWMWERLTGESISGSEKERVLKGEKFIPPTAKSNLQRFMEHAREMTAKSVEYWDNRIKEMKK